MAYDTPATIAILGAGPIGLEAALYARFLGYEVRIYDRGSVAENVLRWGHVPMFTPFALNHSTLGLAAIKAQDPSYEPLANDACPTGGQWAERYLIPLSQTDLLSDHLLLGTTVTSVSRWSAGKGDWVGEPQRADSDFRLLVVDHQGCERADSADIVIDATGTYGQPNWLGPGGAPAVGERSWKADIDYQLPDILSLDRQRFSGRRTLLVGSGHSAATTAVALAQLAADVPQTAVVWVTRACVNAADLGADGAIPPPIARIADDPFPARDHLAQQANDLVSQHHPAIVHRPGWTVTHIDRLEVGPDRFRVHLLDAEHERNEIEIVDRIVSHTGFRGDWSIVEQLQVHLCYATEGPMNLANELAKSANTDRLQNASASAQALLNPEPDFYVLGSKSYGRNSQFLFSHGLDQIRQLFSIIGDRADLDLYAGAKRLLPS